MLAEQAPPAILLPVQLPADEPGKGAKDDPGIGHLQPRVLGSWLPPDPVLAMTAIWAVTQQVGCPTPLYFCHIISNNYVFFFNFEKVISYIKLTIKYLKFVLIERLACNYTKSCLHIHGSISTNVMQIKLSQL